MGACFALPPCVPLRSPPALPARRALAASAEVWEASPSRACSRRASPPSSPVAAAESEAALRSRGRGGNAGALRSRLVVLTVAGASLASVLGASVELGLLFSTAVVLCLGAERKRQRKKGGASPAPRPAEAAAATADVGDDDDGQAAAAAALGARLADLLEGEPRDEVAAAAQRLQRLLGRATLLRRFLTARGGVVEAAEAQFRDVARWRAEVADGIFTESQALKDWAAVGPYWMATAGVATGGTAALATPVAYVKCAYVLPLYCNFSEREIYNSYVRYMDEELRAQVRAREVRSQAGAALTTPQSVEIYDLQGVGLAHCRCVLGLKMLARVLGVGQKYYPENLHRAFIVGAPRLFDLAWRVVRPALDENTQRKVLITSEEYHPDMREFLGDAELEAFRRGIRPFGGGDPRRLRPSGLGL